MIIKVVEGKIRRVELAGNWEIIASTSGYRTLQWAVGAEEAGQAQERSCFGRKNSVGNAN